MENQTEKQERPDAETQDLCNILELSSMVKSKGLREIVDYFNELMSDETRDQWIENKRARDAEIDKQRAEENRRLAFAREKAAQVWTRPETSAIVFDHRLAEEFAHVLVEEMYSPHLGCATTAEIIDELRARISDKDLSYTTIASND